MRDFIELMRKQAGSRRSRAPPARPSTRLPPVWRAGPTRSSSSTTSTAAGGE
ncbi:hypothetical protein [Methanoculleus chikugoensis]|uniref:hypothetical protein n=1 Tax=Methanoculleus chikugoensis TaxID=118126 RepID=UPI001FB21A9A|nr:hypothetical protein [Methanoculleus chikugoensis]